MTRLTCPTCKTKFESDKYGRTYCSYVCRKAAYRKRSLDQHAGDWIWFFKRIINSRQDRKELTPELLVELLKKQNYECALTGIKLTCDRSSRGLKVSTNASIDRIVPGKEYNIDNVQLVCHAINSFRNNMTVDELILWCKKITENALRKQKKTIQKRISARIS